VANETYIDRLRQVIEQMLRCDASHVESVHVHETFRGKIVWEGDVEVFAISKHPKAKTCYAWSWQDGPVEHIATVLRLPPVKTPADAVKTHIVGELKKRKAN